MGTVLETTTADPATGTQSTLAEMLADVMRAERVPVDDHFFDDLGADSLVMAKFCARVRKREDLPSVSMKDIYRYPTIRSLAESFAQAEADADAVSTPVPVRAPVPAEPAATASTREYIVCGTLQLLFFLGYAWAAALVGARAYEWIAAAKGYEEIYLRSVVFGGAGFIVLCTLPILAKWVLIGRWKPRQIRIWSLGYVRFWIVKTLVRSNPLALLTVGSPLYVWYLRALGAKVGRGTVIFSRHVPVCTDLLTIGPDTVIRKESFFGCYRAYAGWIQTGTVTIGRNVFIGEKTVLDINTSMGDVSQLGHASSLHSGQRVPAGERWHGSPAQRTDLNYLRVSAGALRHVPPVQVRRLHPVLGVLPVPAAGRGGRVPAADGDADARPGAGSARRRDHLAGALPRRAVHLAGAVLRLRARSACSRGHRAPPAQPVRQAVRGLSAVRVPRPDPPGDRADDRPEVLHAPVR